MSRGIGEHLGGVVRAVSTSAIASATRGASAAGPATTRARVSARCSQVQASSAW